MSNIHSVELITTTRDQYIFLFRALGNALLKTGHLNDKDRPVNMALRGSRNGGKSLAFDTLWSTLLHDPKNIVGIGMRTFYSSREIDKYMSGTAENGQKMEIFFTSRITLSGNTLYLGKYGPLLEENVRSEGGITAVSNSRWFKLFSSDISVWTESPDEGSPEPFARRKTSGSKKINRLFHEIVREQKEAGGEDFVRFNRISVSSPALRADLQEFMRTFTPEDSNSPIVLDGKKQFNLPEHLTRFVADPPPPPSRKTAPNYVS